MAADPPPLLLVLTVLQGRNIPSLSKTNFIIDAKLANEELSTDPVSHDNPMTGFEINSELAWQMSKKTLLAHRLKRTPLKLVCYCQDVSKPNLRASSMASAS